MYIYQSYSNYIAILIMNSFFTFLNVSDLFYGLCLELNPSSKTSDRQRVMTFLTQVLWYRRLGDPYFMFRSEETLQPDESLV